MIVSTPNPFDLMFGALVLFVVLIAILFLLLQVWWWLTRKGSGPRMERWAVRFRSFSGWRAATD